MAASTAASSTAPTRATRDCARSTCATFSTTSFRVDFAPMADSSVADVDANALLDEANSTSEAQGEPKFSLELNQDQKDIREWVHGFAEGVVRPAAAEWDEREETP